ncbi:hypothetical protein GDO86_006423 [Hymenochirus boettgeri]|uniref:Exonuclease XPMC2 n=1 Tax=Hymenochirus boettgeri TaxID=247094 RepID=A0A8T2JB09_9PIPI|nr:hypothetical protein GDO86_006423 [Hymenochirus boettgeri]
MADTVLNSLFHGFPGSTEFLNSIHKNIPTLLPTVGKTENHRRTRKHLRFLNHKTFLQKVELQRSGHGNPEEEIETPQCSVIKGKELYACESTKDIEKDGQVKAAHKSTFDYDSGLSLAGSTTSSRTSSPVSWLKPDNCVAIDCEMVGTGFGGKISELARCSIVNYRGDVVYDKYVKPKLPITDYRTRWSGITRHHMKSAVPFKSAQREILKLLKGKRVVGHALRHDFKVLKYFHPCSQTRDTSQIPVLKKIAGLPEKPGASLKNLAWNILKKRIQVGSNGHSSVEDAQTALELYKLIEEQWEEELVHSLSIRSATASSSSDHDHYMQDQYWPPELNEQCK